MLKKLAKRIEKELIQAEDYIEQAFLVKYKSVETANLFLQLSLDELGHVEKLLKEGNRIIESNKSSMYYDKAIKSEDEEVYKEKCKIIWDWEYRTSTERVMDIKLKISYFKQIQ